MERDRGAALSGFVRVLCSNPNGDVATRAMVMGALSPLGGVSGQIYGAGKPGTIELLGNFGWPAEDAISFRTLATALPLPACHAFQTSETIAMPWRELHQKFPALSSAGASAEPAPMPDGASAVVVCIPIMWSEQSVGVVVGTIDDRRLGPADWQYLDGVAGVIALWLLEQRRSLIDNWRKTAPLPHAEISLSPRQHRILVLVGNGEHDAEIAVNLGISVPMIRQDIQEMMELLGAETRDAGTGRARDIGLLPDRRVRDGAR